MSYYCDFFFIYQYIYLAGFSKKLSTVTSPGSRVGKPETRAGTRVFLKSETKTDRKPAVKITLQYKRSGAFCEKGKIARKKLR